LGPPRRTFVMQEEALTACWRHVQISGFKSNDEFVAEWRVDNGSTMSHLAQSHRSPADRRPVLLQDGEDRTRRHSRRRRQVRPPGSSFAVVVVVLGWARRIGGRRPAEVVGYDGYPLTGTGPNQPRTAAVGAECRQVSCRGGDWSEPRLVGARTAANGTNRRRRRQRRQRRNSIMIIRDCMTTQSSHYNTTAPNCWSLASNYSTPCKIDRASWVYRPDCKWTTKFAVDGPATWNRLPPALRTPDLSESAFKRAQKTCSRPPGAIETSSWFWRPI